jgi:plastocyanin
MLRRFTVGVALLAATFVFAATASAMAAKPKKAGAVKKVTVTMTEFKFAFTPKTYKVGDKVTFTVRNKGVTGHDFDIAGVKNMPVIAGGKTFKYTVSFKKKGVYRYVCTVPRHAELGMTGRLTVK